MNAARSRSAKPDELERSRMTFGEHLTELRSRLIKALARDARHRRHRDGVRRRSRALPARAVPAGHARDQPRTRRSWPRARPGRSITYFKVSLIVGLHRGGAVLDLADLGVHRAPGLYKKERRWVLRFAPLSFLLFVGGVVVRLPGAAPGRAQVPAHVPEPRPDPELDHDRRVLVAVHDAHADPRRSRSSCPS